MLRKYLDVALSAWNCFISLLTVVHSLLTSGGFFYWSQKLDKIADWLYENATVLMGAGFAFLISMLTHKEGKCMDRIGSSFLCSLFSTGLYYGIVSFFPSVPNVAAVAIGSFVGFFGVDECKRMILDRLKSLIGSGRKGGRDEE